MAHPFDDLVQIFPDFGRMAAFVRLAGGQEVVEGVLAGDLTVERVGQTLQIKEAVRPLFDKNGRRIPPRGLVGNVCDPNREFHLNQPRIDYAERLHRLVQFFPPESSFPSAVDFEAKCRALLELVKADPQLTNLQRGDCLPICLPCLTVLDYGQSLDEFFIPSVGRAYTLQFPGRPFKNYRQGELQGKVSIVDGTRHEQLLARMAEDSLVGLYFPNPLQGYSVHAQREQMNTLPESLLLAGGLDTATAWVMYPEVMARDFKTPGYDCSALQWQSSEASLCFEADDGRADFGSRADLSHADDGYSGGLLFIG